MGALLHPYVQHVGHGFSAVGMSTPATIAHKAQLILTPAWPGERVAVVVVDAVRCSSTIVALMAAGAAAVTVSRKDGGGPTIEEARAAAKALGAEMVVAGELHGRPIPGGVIGNSPRDAASALVHGRLVAFHSTNFGAAFTTVLAWRDVFTAAGGDASVVTATFANTARVAAYLRGQRFDRVAIAAGGFYNTVSIEDMVVGGDVLLALGCNEPLMDDEARLMVDAALARPDASSRLRSFRSNWIGRSLEHFGMEADIAAVVSGVGIPPTLWRQMTQQLPMAGVVAGVPVLLPGHINDGIAAPAVAGGRHADASR